MSRINKIEKLAGEFECQRCGKCCTSYGRIQIRFSDVERLEKAHVDTYGIIYDKNGIPYLNTHDDGSCYYYNEEFKECEIHRYKPLDCRLFPFMLHGGWFWKKTCLKKRKRGEEDDSEKLFLITDQYEVIKNGI